MLLIAILQTVSAKWIGTKKNTLEITNTESKIFQTVSGIFQLEVLNNVWIYPAPIKIKKNQFKYRNFAIGLKLTEKQSYCFLKNSPCLLNSNYLIS